MSLKGSAVVRFDMCDELQNAVCSLSFHILPVYVFFVLFFLLSYGLCDAEDIVAVARLMRVVRIVAVRNRLWVIDEPGSDAREAGS